MKKFYITTPIYYPNDIPHIGHAYTTVAADVIARWHKLSGEKVRFLTGTDEHGKKIQDTAEKKGKTPKEFVDELIPKFKDAWKKLGINYDRFIRTTDKDHEKVVQEILQKVYDKKEIYLGEYEGYYCTGCEAYYTEKDLEEGCCPIHKTKIEKLKEPSYFFRLSKYQKKLLEFYKKNPDFISPDFRKKEIINRVKEGLEDLSISRTSFDWGIQLPFDKKHVCYVWFDALLNYYSGADGFWPADVHLVGKDILWFHSVIWPAMLLSAEIELPKKVFAHGWWTFNNEKISKSRGKVINVDELISIAGVDAVRYFLFRETPFGEDGDFSEKALIERYNNELADKLGNLVSRVAALIEKYGLEKTELKKLPNEIITDLKKEKGFLTRGIIINTKAIDISEKIYNWGIIYPHTNKKDYHPNSLNELLNALLIEIEKNFNELKIDKALNEIFSFIDSCNEYIQAKKPWETHDKKVLYELADSIKAIAILISPFIPESAEKIAKQFGFEIKYENINKPLNDKVKIKKEEVLFKKIEVK